MKFLNKIFDEVINDFSKEEYRNQHILSRKYVFDNSIVCIIYYNNRLNTREVAFRLPKDCDSSLVSKFPNWKGINVVLSNISYEEFDDIFIVFQQLPEYDSFIYETVIQDLIDKLLVCKDERTIINVIGKVLSKWKQFFVMNNEVIMSDVKQQGLYGELILLNKLMGKYGDKVLGFWTGCNGETHDFYINGDAIEVKTTSSNNGNKAMISNEYQLDNNDVSGELYLMFASLRRSKSDGETVPEIVKRISEQILQIEAIEIFDEMLFKYGYIKNLSEFYQIGFTEREIRFFHIKEDFPKITKSLIANNIGNVSYAINLDACDRFSILENKFIDGLKE